MASQLREIPTGIAARWELIVKLASERLHRKRKQISEVIGERPYKGLPVREEELDARWAQIRHEGDSLVEVFQSNAKFKPDGRVLVPKALIDGMIKQEKKKKDGGND
ncbi:hypothetical protein LCGC14_1888400 [marine sediment metagenome]|uniref:Uncharacterized protein n=1 Tax=marine sediment metagenome TaxID=412755 RepID=A0A0F9G0E6_9ZZZZ